MAIVASDWTIDRATGNIRYVGDDHNGASPSYATVIQFHRFLSDLNDDPEFSGDDELDIIDKTPSNRSTDNIITLVNGFNIDATAAEHLFDGSIIQAGGNTVYDGIVNFGNADVQIQIIQNGSVLADDWWNYNGAGLNPDANQGISHRFMLLVRDAGADIDGRRLIGTSKTFGNTFSEFKINGTSNGNNVLALTDSGDLNNTTVVGTIAALTDIYIDRVDSTTSVDGVNNTGQNVLNVADGTQFTAGDFIMTGVATDQQEYQITSIATNALTLNQNLQVATVGAETVYKLNLGYTEIDVDGNGVNENYYAQWDKGSNSINTYYERMKWLVRDGSTSYVYGLPGELFRGITHEIDVDTPTGTFAAVEGVSWGSGATAGTGQMLAINSPTAATKMWIQLLTGVLPTDGTTITGSISGATVDMNLTITERPVSTPFVGQSTGTALIGAFGLTLQTDDLLSTDTVFDLGNNAVTPPNNVTFIVTGMISGEDYVLVTNNNGGDIDFAQMALNATYSTAGVTTISVNAIPVDCPSTGTIRIQRANGLYSRHAFSARDLTTDDFTIASTDFSTNNANSGANVFISYLDNLYDGTTATDRFTYVYNADRTHFIRVRDGGTAGDGEGIKTFESTSTMGSNGGGTSINRIADV